ncbi:uncharacterized protein DC041_0012386 [Schistosoma bovis]|uniref:EF-hand domain-containing protein n=1 Tax=Schistosoma bovis TaxID=6184 RepID=A0A430Q7A3_SCHBO|nr:uncharacterized protein DC041_0012386 [Schistosoma bovis]
MTPNEQHILSKLNTWVTHLFALIQIISDIDIYIFTEKENLCIQENLNSNLIVYTNILIILLFVKLLYLSLDQTKTKKEMSEEMLLNLFSRLDKNGDGILSKEELKQGLRSSGVTENAVNKLIEKLDLNFDNNITYEEYIQAIRHGNK